MNHTQIEWVEEIVRVADGAGIPVFLKDNLMPLIDGTKSKMKLNCWGKFQHIGLGSVQFKLRQEMPSA